MEVKLAEALVNKGVLKAGTEVEARHRAVGLGGVSSVTVTDHFSIVSATVKVDKVIFVLEALRDGARTKVTAEDIQVIDGMDPVRFASVYNIKADGGAAKVGARRGRKPKNRNPELLGSPNVDVF